MSVVGAAVRTVGKTANKAAGATTGAAGALGGAAVNGIVGGAQGAAEGVKHGISAGSHSTSAAALTFGALGVVGLVEWPVLLGVGGGALLLQKLSPAAPHTRDSPEAGTAEPTQVNDRSQRSAKRSAAKKTAGHQELRTTS